MCEKQLEWGDIYNYSVQTQQDPSYTSHPE